MKLIKIFCYAGVFLIGITLLSFAAHLLFPDIEWLWKIN